MKELHELRMILLLSWCLMTLVSVSRASVLSEPNSTQARKSLVKPIPIPVPPPSCPPCPPTPAFPESMVVNQKGNCSAKERKVVYEINYPKPVCPKHKVIYKKAKCPKPVSMYSHPAPAKKKECVFVKKIKPLFYASDRSPFFLPLSPMTMSPPKICLQKFSMYFIDMEPYSGPMFRHLLNETVGKCCWELNEDPVLDFVPASSLSSILQQNLREKIIETDMRQGDQVAHFIFPILGFKEQISSSL